MTRRPKDSGLQPERTLLSWQRTLIVLVAVTLLFMRDPIAEGAAGGAGPLVRLLPALAAAALAGILMAHVRRRWRRTDHGRRDDRTGLPPAPLARPWAMALLGVTTGCLAVVVAVTALPGLS